MRSLLLLTIMLLGVVGCARTVANLQQQPTHSITPTITNVNADQISPTQTCPPVPVVHTMLDFMEAYNTGGVEQFRSFIDKSFATFADNQFRTVIHSPNAQRASYPPSDPSPLDKIEDHVRQRIAENDHLELRMVEISDSWRPEAVDVLFFLSRRADDLGKEPTPYIGKGTVRCVLDEQGMVVERKIVLWVIGLPLTERSHLCSSIIKPVPLIEPVSQVAYCVKD